MASGNQGQGRRNEGRDRGNGGQGGRGDVREQMQGLAQGARQGAEQVAGRLREGYGMATDELGRRYRRAEGTIARNPAPSVLIGFGLGFGLGLALTALMTRDEDSSWSGWSRSLSGSMRDIPASLHRMKDLKMKEAREGMKAAREGVKAASESHLVDSVQDSIHQLAESLRDLPSMLAKMMPGR